MLLWHYFQNFHALIHRYISSDYPLASHIFYLAVLNSANMTWVKVVFAIFQEVPLFTLRALGGWVGSEVGER